jgi:hypothetical protein
LARPVGIIAVAKRDVRRAIAQRFLSPAQAVKHNDPNVMREGALRRLEVAAED